MKRLLWLLLLFASPVNAVPVVPNASVTFNISVSPTPNIPVGESS